MQPHPASLAVRLSSLSKSSLYQPLLLDTAIQALFPRQRDYSSVEEVSGPSPRPGLACPAPVSPLGHSTLLNKDKVPLVSPITMHLLFVASLLSCVTYREHSAVQPLNTQK